jgi:hypothetical protein
LGFFLGFVVLLGVFVLVGGGAPPRGVVCHKKNVFFFFGGGGPPPHGEVGTPSRTELSLQQGRVTNI